MIIFISVACGADNSVVPNPHAEFKRISTPPIASADTTEPINSPICCFLGVAPRMYPVFKSCEVSPAIAATIQMIDPMAMAPPIPCTPVSPVTFKQMVANNKVAIAIPETGLLLLPTSPTIREETVAKKNPNTTIRIAPRRVTGITGTNQMVRIITRTPIPMILISRS